MILEKLKNLIHRENKRTRDFSSFFNDASHSEKQKLMERVVRQANDDQRRLIEDKTRAN